MFGVLGRLNKSNTYVMSVRHEQKLAFFQSQHTSSPCAGAGPVHVS